MFRRRTAGALSFHRDEHHSSVIIFVTMSVAWLSTAGAALDYARVTNMREGLSAGVAAASTAGLDALRDTTLSNDAIEAIALSHFDQRVSFARQVGTVELPSVTVDRNVGSVTVEAKGTVAMTVSRIFGLREVSVPAEQTATWASQSADAH
jgi:hypothetical protein